MKIEITLPEDFNLKNVEQAEEVFKALVKTGALTGVKGGKAIIHYDGEGNFQAIQLDYMPFRRRKPV